MTHSRWRGASAFVVTITILVFSGITARGDSVTIQNSRLIVEFEADGQQMSLRRVAADPESEGFLFSSSDPFQIVLATEEQASDPAYQATYDLQDGFQTMETNRSDSSTVVTTYSGDLADIVVRYTLDPEAPVLRKTIECTAKDQPLTVAGIRLWLLEPGNGEVVWSKDGAIGQPIVVANGNAGYFATLEWPRAQSINDDGRYSLEYRPGIALQPGESAEIAAGSIGLFTKEYPAQPILDAGRLAFFDHVTARVQPDFPFPVKFTTWGPWMGQADALRILRVVDDLEYIGADILHFDAGWQENEYPYTQHYLKAGDASDEEWDLTITNDHRLPNGLLPLKEAADRHGLKLSLWFDACASVFMQETPDWAARDENGNPVYTMMWEQKEHRAPRLSLAGRYGEVVTDFVRDARKHYSLGGVMFDNNHYPHDIGPGRKCLANGWNSEDIQLGVIMSIFDEANRDTPGIYRFYCNGSPWAWALLHATHIHGGDPGTSGTMRSAAGSDYPARALAFERRRAWQNYYNNFVPPWGVKGDVAGWSMQQQSPIPINLDYTNEVIASGEGWVQNMFTCFAVTAVRDIRFSFDQMPSFDRDILKEWLAWDRSRSHFITNLRGIRVDLDDPDTGAGIFSQVGNGEGVIYLFNQSFETDTLSITLDESAGFAPGDKNLSANLVYPVRARYRDGSVSYGDVLTIPVIAKDCVVIEIGLPTPSESVSFGEYEQQADTVARSFSTQFSVDLSEVSDALSNSAVRVEVGDIPQDRILARQILESLGVLRGESINLDESLAVPANKAGTRVVIGTLEGLQNNEVVSDRFVEALYDRFVRWDGKLVSGPLVARLPGVSPETLCFIAPRPDQLSRLSKDLTARIVDQASNRTALVGTKTSTSLKTSLKVPSTGNACLTFNPIMVFHHHMAFPNDMEPVEYELWAETNGKRSLIWNETIAPFRVLGNGAWWNARLASLENYEGMTIEIEARVAHAEDLPEYSEIGFRGLELLQFEE